MGKDLTKVGKVMYFCAGGPCVKKGAEGLIRETRALLKTEGLYHSTHTVKTLCSGQCEHGPIMAVQPDNSWYRQLDARKCERVVREHILGNQPVTDLALYTGEDNICHADAATLWNPSKRFENRILDGLGQVQVADMDPWEMNLYPFLKDLFVHRYHGLEFKIPALGMDSFPLEHPASIEYDGIRAEVTSGAKRFSFVIGLCNEMNPEYPFLKQLRISEVSFYRTDGNSTGPQKLGIVAKSRSGESVLEVRFTDSDGPTHLQPWNHFTRIYLDFG